MRRIVIAIFAVVGIFLYMPINAAVLPADSNNKEAWKDIKAREVLRLSARDISKISGQKMSLKQKLVFRISKINMRMAVRRDPELSYGSFLNAQKKISSFALVTIALVSIATVFVIAGTRLNIGTWIH